MSKTVFFLDIDDTLTETSRLTKKQVKVVEKSLAKIGIKKASIISQEFYSSFSKQFDQHQGLKLTAHEKVKLESDLDEMCKRQKLIVAKFGKPKIWSREAWIYLSAEKYGIKLSNKYLMYITNRLWSKITQSITFYPDVFPFLKLLVQKKIIFHLITASDCRLKFDDNSGQFIYDPTYSHKLKMDRLKIFANLGISKENIFIADPYDKPDPWVFKKALTYVQRKNKGDEYTTFMIGDSVTNDLIPAKSVGIEKLVLVWRKNKKPQIENAGITIVNDLWQIPQLFVI